MPANGCTAAMKISKQLIFYDKLFVHLHDQDKALFFFNRNCLVDFERDEE